MAKPSDANYFGPDVVRRYDADEAAMFTHEAIEPAVALLVELAGQGAALEFAIGTGRLALPLSARGVTVSGIEYSAAMIAELRKKPGAERITVVEGDMAATRAPGEFQLVYLVFNTIGNLTSQDKQVACFENAAAHLAPGGYFLIELGVPGLRRFVPGSRGIAADITDEHACIDTYDPLTQLLSSHHFMREANGSFRRGFTPQRYAWPSELDLMARIAGLSFAGRWSDWGRSPFTAESPKHISVWRKPD